MKHKIYVLATFLLFSLLFVSCAGEEDDIFSKSAAERIADGAEAAAARLVSSPAGWAMEYYPTYEKEDPYGLGYLLLTDFNVDGSVTMAMNNLFSDNVYLEDTSAWEIITDDGVVLTYNTFNKCIHAFCDPEDIPSTSDSETGYGCEGDYEFIVVDIPEETSPEYLMLKGKKRGVYVRLSRLEEGTVFQEYIEDVQAFNKRMFPSSVPNYLVLTVGDDVMEVDDMSTGLPNIYEFGTDAITNECHYPYLVIKHNGKYHLRFRDKVVTPKEYTTQELIYDEVQDCFVDVDDDNITLQGPVPAEFFMTELSAGNMWQIRRASDMSEAASAIYEEVYNAMSASSRTLQYVRFTQNSDNVRCAFNYQRRQGGTGSFVYSFSCQETENGVTLTYIGAEDDTAENLLTTIPSIKDLLDALSGNITISAVTSRFNLSDVLFASSDSMWFVFALN